MSFWRSEHSPGRFPDSDLAGWIWSAVDGTRAVTATVADGCAYVVEEAAVDEEVSAAVRRATELLPRLVS